ncbi:MAG: DUF4919 domain-containing protein, partial [Candidatus Kapaibacterium sp.]
MKFTSIIVILLVTCGMSFAQQSKIVPPPFHDHYSEMVKKLESGDTNINYREFRESFIESQQFIAFKNQESTFDSLTKLMYDAMHQKTYQNVVQLAQQMLSLDYTSMLAHKILQQTFNILGDSINHKKYHAIEFGLLNSILQNGDGKTCATGWPVIQTSEEYFIFDMADATVKQQSLDQTGGVCDKMEVTT